MKNWKTTVAGAIAAVAVAITTVVQQGASLADWKTWITPVAIALLGYLAGDKTPKKP
jgi:hypothetical protein